MPSPTYDIGPPVVHPPAVRLRGPNCDRVDRRFLFDFFLQRLGGDPSPGARFAVEKFCDSTLERFDVVMEFVGEAT